MYICSGGFVESSLVDISFSISSLLIFKGISKSLILKPNGIVSSESLSTERL